MKTYEFELQMATDKLIQQILRVKTGETVVITADTCSDARVVNTTAASVYAAGAKPMVIYTSTPEGVGKAADSSLPVEALGATLSKSDVWIEYNAQWLLYSTPFEIAHENNGKLRHICLVEMTPDVLIRNIGKVPLDPLAECLKAFAAVNRNAKRIKVETPAGTALTFETNPRHLVACDAGDASSPGVFMMPGQVNIVPKFGTVNGVLVFDGSLSPPCGLLDAPIVLKIEQSKIVRIDGGRQAEAFARWLADFDDANMMKLAHMAYGLNPGAKLTGNIVEDERVWGATEWGIGYVSPLDAPPNGQVAKSHCDGICLNASVWLDDELYIKDGEFVHEAFQKRMEKLAKTF